AIQNQLIPAGQLELFEELIATTIQSAELASSDNKALNNHS
ncbi:thiamine biosynthesis protein ThiJ, partial [Vibrio parahaemolyticus]|nr:thiamine biosynthesis protein ThiJ [Vibrio parahaemolyticus]